MREMKEKEEEKQKKIMKLQKKIIIKNNFFFFLLKFLWLKISIQFKFNLNDNNEENKNRKFIVMNKNYFLAAARRFACANEIDAWFWLLNPKLFPDEDRNGTWDEKLLKNWLLEEWGVPIVRVSGLGEANGESEGFKLFPRLLAVKCGVRAASAEELFSGLSGGKSDIEDFSLLNGYETCDPSFTAGEEKNDERRAFEAGGEVEREFETEGGGDEPGKL